MRRTILITCILILSLACKAKDKSIGSDINELTITEHNTSMINQNEETEKTVNIFENPIDTDFEDETNAPISKEEIIYTFDRFREEFTGAFNVFLLPMGTFFWDEFEDIAAQYELTEDESKLLGTWMNVTFYLDLVNNYYTFFPNKLFFITFNFENIKISSTNNMFYDKAIGTWEIINGIVQITIHAIIIENKTGYMLTKNVFRISHPYTVDFINIDDIDIEGFTRRPINDTILSDELHQMVRIKEPNMTNNLYVRNIYSIDVITNSGRPEKNYRHFNIVRKMAQENLSGLDIVTNTELIIEYIFNLRP